MAKTPKSANVSGSGSRTAFVKALHAVRRRNGVELPQNSGTKRTSSRNSSASNARKPKKGNVYARCSPLMTSELLGDIQSGQRLELIKEMGFDGLRHLNIFKTNRHFGAWLLSKYDPISGSLKWGARSEIKLTYQHVNFVLGIPFQGKDIVPATHQEMVTMKKYISAIFGKEKFEQITVPFLSSILLKRHNGPMSAEEVVKFKTAFILFLVTKFLGPVSLNNHISSRYMKPLVDIDNVHKYNWAKFAVDELKVAADSLQRKLKDGKSAGYINGCLVLLQVIRNDCFIF